MSRRSHCASVATFIRRRWSALSSSVSCGLSVTRTSTSLTIRAVKSYSASSGQVSLQSSLLLWNFFHWSPGQLPLPWGIAVFSLYHLAFSVYFVVSCLQRFDAVGWAAGRASGLQKTRVLGCWRGDLHIAQLTHCNSLSLASVKSRLVLHFWYHLTRVVLDKGPLNGCVCVCGFTLLPAFECTLN